MTDETDRPFPPGPRGPEETNVPAPKLSLSPEQAKSIAELASRCSYLDVEDRGAGYREVTLYDAEGEQIDIRRVFSGRLLRDQESPRTSGLPTRRLTTRSSS